MTVGRNGYGSSEQTREKLECFDKLITMHLRIGDALCKPGKDRYLYVDMNAGPGVVPDMGIYGSPLLFLNAVPPTLSYDAFFIENHPGRAQSLTQAVAAYGDDERFDPHVSICRGDHLAIAPRIVATQRGTPVGMVYHDPNGEPSFDTLIAMSHLPQAHRLDFVIYFGATSIKRANGMRQVKALADPNMYIESRVTPLVESLSRIAKRHWIVQQPLGKWNWTYVIGTNWADFPTWRKAGFHAVNTEQGQEILDRLTSTKEERAARSEPPAVPYVPRVSQTSLIPPSPAASNPSSNGHV